MKGCAIEYIAEELVCIEAHKDWPRRQLHAGFCFRFGRADVKLDNFKALCKRKGWMTGRTGGFAPGQPALNKGRKMPFHPNSAATRFKKGSTPANRKPMGDERLDRYGYIEMKVPLADPYTGHATRWRHKHSYLWELANGPLPPGMALKCLDGERTNTDPANWQAIPRALLPRLNGRYGRGYDAAAAEIKPTIMAIARLEHQARGMRKNRDREAK